MKRYLTIARCMALSAFTLAGAGAIAQQHTLIVTTNVPQVHWASTQGGEPWMACVKEATNNQIAFNYFPNGQIAGFFESLNAVNKGLAHISYIVVSAQTDKLPLNGIPMLPELGDTVVEMTKGVRKAFDGNTLIAKEFADNRIVPLLVNMFPPYQMLSRGRPFADLDSLRGKKITSGGGSLIVTLNALGANPIEMPAGDIYLSMQQGAIDGAMLALASVKPYKLEEVSKSMSSNGAFGSANGTWAIDTGVWAKLSPEHQKAMRDCGVKIEMQLAEWVDKWSETLKSEFKGKGIDVYEFSPAAKKAISEKLALSRKDYVDRLTKRGLPAQQALDEYMKILGR